MNKRACRLSNLTLGGALLLATLTMVTTLSGCTLVLPGTVQRLPPLQIAGLQRMVGLSQLNGATTADGIQDFIQELPFQQGDGMWQVLLDSGGSGRPLAVAAHDGSGFRILPLAHTC
jgi:hypothetical protein